MLIGRDEQLSQIGDFLRETVAGGGTQNVLFVTGEAGIGKSTLLRSTREECERMSPRPVVAVVECSTPLAGQNVGEVEALQPWAAIIASLATDQQSEKKLEAKKLVTDLAMAWVTCIPVVGDVLGSAASTVRIVRDAKKGGSPEPDSAQAASQSQMFQQYINLLIKLADRSPLVLMIDDFHWADASSANLLFAAARQLVGRPVLFIVAYRPDDASSAQGGEGHPLIHVRNELERYDLVAEIGVPRMTARNLDALLRARYTNYVNNDRFEEWIARVSGGNALFITQFLNTLEEDGHIDRVGGRIEPGFESIRVPQSAYAVVQERIRRLSEDARELLRYASVEGDTFTSAILARITETPQLKLLQKLRLMEETHGVIRALGKQLVYAKETSAYQFAHVLLQRAMYESLGEEERELLHEAMLDVLKEEWETAKENGVNLPGIAARIAIHAEVLKNYRFAIEALLEAARGSWQRYAEKETLQIVDSIFSLAEKCTSAKDKAAVEPFVAAAHEVRGEVHSVRARYEAALGEYCSAGDHYRKSGRTQELIDVAVSEAEMLYRLERNDDSSKRAKEALAEAESSGYARGETRALLLVGRLISMAGNYHESMEWFTRALEAARRAGARAEEASAIDYIGILHEYLGEYEQAEKRHRESIEIFESIDDRRGVAAGLMSLGNLLLSTGEFARSAEHYQRGLDIFTTTGDREGEGQARGNLGVAYLSLDDYEHALDSLHAALQIYRDIGSRYGEAMVLSAIGDLHHSLEEFDQALDYTRHAYEVLKELGSRRSESNMMLNMGTILRKLGRLEEARTNLEQALEIARETGSKDTVALSLGSLGMLEQEEAKLLDGAEREALMAHSIEQIEECVRIYEEIGHGYAAAWRETLEEVRAARAS